LNTQTPVFTIVIKLPSSLSWLKKSRTFRNPIFVAMEELHDEMTRGGISQAELARKLGLSRTRVHQWLSLLELPKKDIERLKAMGDNWDKMLITERTLRSILTCR
jgi:hypothetical protein